MGGPIASRKQQKYEKNKLINIFVLQFK